MRSIQRTYVVWVGDVVYTILLTERDPGWDMDPLKNRPANWQFDVRLGTDGKSVFVPYKSLLGKAEEAKYAIQSAEPFEGSLFDPNRGYSIKRYHPPAGVIFE